MWYLQEDLEDLNDPGLDVSVAIGSKVFTADVMIDEEKHGRECAAVMALEWLQEAKNRKFTDMIKASQANRLLEGSDEATRTQDDLNDID